MEPSICEFIAENELIQIVPNFKERQIHLICGDFGPFEAGSPIHVPVWFAMHLRGKHKCAVVPPEWLNVEELKKLVFAETEKTTGFGPIPEHLFEIAHILITGSSESLDNVEQIKTLVKDLQDKRESKMRASIVKFLEQFQKEKDDIGSGKTIDVRASAQMTNLTRFEISYFRAALVEPSRQLDRLFDTLNSTQQQQQQSMLDVSNSNNNRSMDL